MKRIAVFASGSGSNAENLATYFANHSEITVALVLSDRKNAFVLQRMAPLGVPTRFMPKEDFENGTVLELLKRNKIDLIVLAGFLRLVSPSLLAAYPHRIINLHPALLPKFGGKGMFGMHVHEAVVEAGEPETGITIHFIDAKFDEGEIIAQYKTEIFQGETAESIAAKIHLLEMKWYPNVVEKVCNELA
ncbi:MAG: phosphoribosylglycinamide formyltransferase [Bacteroidetes bacterium]|nr:phosphoribosylglycinamide formyltransferase [Bacteroidota bacterium]